MAPTSTRQLLGGSGDPLYDLCNPPPVTLVSRGSDSVSSKKNTESLIDHKLEGSPAFSVSKPPEESPAYIHRSAHPDGNIIVTADYTGRIKVFRQDCAYTKRKNDAWETSSAFSKKVGGSLFSGHGRRNSTRSHPGSDRILSWRQSIASNGSLDGSRGNRNSSGLDGNSSNRSVSPRKSMGAMSIGSGSTTHQFMRSDSVRSRASRATSVGVDTSPNSGQNAYSKTNGVNYGHSGSKGTSSRKLLLDEEQTKGFRPNHAVGASRSQEANEDMGYYTSGVPTSRALAGGRPHRLSAVGSDESGDNVFSSDEGEESENETVRCKRSVMKSTFLYRQIWLLSLC